ncbi:girdin-like isoform X1 [Limulus polyphemus]|uniref:Girdin-like isoform X1 n=1 Tax=Limulus polyphemus TaxID=6850 RepID=A0ABM1SZV9_LIMPO|nr:girdin-like isoform X1 [Limulus polyphemus]
MVQHVVSDLQSSLVEMIKLINNTQENRQNVVDLSFDKILSDISHDIIDLLDKAQNLTDQKFIILKQLRDLKAKLLNSTKLSRQIKLKVQKTKSISDLGKERISTLMEHIESVSKIVLNMKSYLTNITLEFLKNSSNVTKKFEQQSDRMKEIAKEAGRLADCQKIEEEETKKVAVKALNISTLAYSGTQSLVQAQNDVSLTEVKELQNMAFGMEQLLSRAKNEGYSAAEVTSRAYNEILELLNQGKSLNVPEFNEQVTMYRNLHIINEATGTIEKIDNILEKNSHLDDEIKEQKSKACGILNEAILLQKGKETLMTDIQAALDKAKENVQFGETILYNAKQLPKKVKECDNIVQKYKKEDVSSIETILSLITESDQKTGEKRTALSKAETVTVDAKEKARESELIVSPTFQIVRKLEENTEGTTTRTKYVLQESHYVFQKALEVADQMELYEVETEVDNVLAEKVQSKTAKLGHLVGTASLKVKRSLDALQAIMNELETLDSLDSADLYRIEYELEKVQNEDIVLAKKIKYLQVLKKKQQKTIDELEKNIEAVRREVKESENIAEAIKHF